MTKEQCREAGATMIAWADGKSIQYRRRDQSEWFDVEPACTATTLSWDWDEFEYRVKPMPKLRPWTADEVPARACRIIERELNAANERIKQLEEALSCVVPTCLGLHHSKKHRHKYNEPCPVEKLVFKAKEAKP